jgi:hypothetical protein
VIPKFVRRTLTAAALRLALVMPALLLTPSTGCTRTAQVPVAEPAIPCQMDPFPPFPGLSVSICRMGDQDVDCLSPADAWGIWEWVRSAQRWADRAEVCLDMRY